MRFAIELEFSKDLIQKDKNRLIISLLKKAFLNFNEDFYNRIYEEDKTLRKDFTFAIYLGNCEFLREEIKLQIPKAILNISTFNYIEGIMIYNSFHKLQKDKTECIFGENNFVKVVSIKKVYETIVNKSSMDFKTLSPIVVKEHRRSLNDEQTFYHSIENEKGLENLNKFMKAILTEKFPQKYKDILNLQITLKSNVKVVKVKNYGIVFPTSLCIINIKGNSELIDYIYKSGIGSKTNSGFGMLSAL